jgi:beta-lactamase class A
MRRLLLPVIAAALLLAGCTGGDDEPDRRDGATPTTSPTFSADFADLEKEYDARLGVYAIDTGTGQVVEHRAGERFAYASTIKALAVGALLHEKPRSVLDQPVEIGEEDLVENSPELEKAVADGQTELTVREVADAAVRYSDNTAGNLLFALLGGPEELQGVLREIGDDTTIVSRIEPELNEAVPGDDRDTTTPEALATTLRANTLLPADGKAVNDGYARALLTDLMVRNTTGDDLIRAGVPENWEVADKTGAAAYGTRNDVAVLRRPDGAPIVLAVMSTKSDPDADYDDDLVADATRVAIASLVGEQD